MGGSCRSKESSFIGFLVQQIPGINAEILKRFAPNTGRKPLLPQLSAKRIGGLFRSNGAIGA
jgi:hypothetical protein